MQTVDANASLLLTTSAVYDNFNGWRRNCRNSEGAAQNPKKFLRLKMF